MLVGFIALLCGHNSWTMTYHCGIFSTSSSVRRLHVSAAAHKYEVLVCKGKTCRRQGAEQIKQFAKDLALGVVDVKECGCLGELASLKC